MSASVPVPSDIRDKRSQPRFDVNRRARLLHGPSGLATATIVDLSAGGAKVKLDKPEGVADTLVLVDLSIGVAHEAQVAWRKGQDVGLRFNRKHDLKGLVPAHLRVAKQLWHHEGDPPPPAPVIPLMPRVAAESEPAPPPEPSESRKAVSALTQAWRAKLAAGGLDPN